MPDPNPLVNGVRMRKLARGIGILGGGGSRPSCTFGPQAR
jgi:hypothetical protein